MCLGDLFLRALIQCIEQDFIKMLLKIKKIANVPSKPQILAEYFLTLGGVSWLGPPRCQKLQNLPQKEVIFQAEYFPRLGSRPAMINFYSNLTPEMAKPSQRWPSQ